MRDRKRHYHEVSSSGDSDDSDIDTTNHKSPRVNSNQSCVKSSKAPANREDDKVSILDEREINRNLIALQRESDDNNSGKDGIEDGEDDFKELTQEINKEDD